MEKFNVEQFNPKMNYAIEASAGSGKTYSVVEMVIKLLKSGVSLNQILLVTYTEKAAGELKNRIRKSILKENIPGIDLDTSEIYTIHSFCKKVFDEYNSSRISAEEFRKKIVKEYPKFYSIDISLGTFFIKKAK